LGARWPVAVAEPELMASAYSRLNPLAVNSPRAEELVALAGDLLHSYAAGIVELTPTIDRVYIRKWAGALGIADLWDRVAGGAG